MNSVMRIHLGIILMVYLVIILFLSTTFSGLLYDKYGLFINIYLTVFITPVLLLLIVYVKDHVYFDNLSMYMMGYFIYVFISGVLVSNYNPAIFILFAIILYTVAGSTWSKKSDDLFNSMFEYLAVLVIAASLILSFFTDYERFSGFSISPTTLSIYLMIIYVVLVVDKSKLYTLLFGLPVVYLLVISQTRSALVLFILILLFAIGYGKPKNLKKIFIATVIILSFLYPIYGVISDFTESEILLREGDLQDDSFITRYWLTMYIYEDYLESNLFHMLFGLGAEQSRSLVRDYYGYDLHVHNDILRLLYDYGIIGSILYFSILYKLSLRNRVTYTLVIIYMFSFFHNMIYDVYQLCVMIIFAQQRERDW